MTENVEKNKKGFFFAIDSLIAVIIAFVLIVGIAVFVNKAQDDKLSTLYLEKIANDILFTINKNKTLETLDQIKIQNVLSGVLPKNLAATLNITTFVCSDQPCSSFQFDSNIVITIPSGAVEKDALIARTGFITFKGGKIDRFAIADLRIWLI